MRSQARSISAWKKISASVVIATTGLLSASAHANQTVSAGQVAAQLLAQGRCEDGADKLNVGLSERDPQAYFVAGFMYARGVCVVIDVPRALPLLEVAAKAGWMEAARELALIHGSGRGVDQSYAESGRWAVAMLDIMDLRLGLPRRTIEGAAKGSLDVDRAEAYGYLVTVHELAGDRVRLALDRKLGLSEIPALVAIGVTLSLPGPRAEVEVSGVERLRDASGSRPRGQTPEGRLVVGVREAYEEAMKRLPEPPRTSVVVRLSQPYTFRML